MMRQDERRSVCVSLQGTFDTLSVTELFGLLSTAAKTGALRLEAGEHEAAVFVSAGRCCAVESDAATGPAGSDGELASRLVDVGFTLARQPSGSFRFADSELPSFETTLATPLEPAVAEITSMLDQWREIEATIPSLDVRVRLAPVLRGEQIVVTAPEWLLLVALEGRPSVREVVAQRNEPVIQVCRLLKELADRGAIEVGTDMGRPGVATEEPTERGRRGRGDAASSPIDPSEPYAPGAETTARTTGMAVAGSPSGVAAVAAAANAIAAAEADAIAAGLASRMTRSRRPVPDAFAGADEAPTERDGAATSQAATSEEATAEAAKESEPEEGSQDRGALLRLFSALKES